MHLTPEEEEFGPCLLAAKHPLLEEYLALKKADLTRLADNLALSRSQEAAAVSYTHLDVYKRQRLPCLFNEKTVKTNVFTVFLVAEAGLEPTTFGL